MLQTVFPIPEPLAHRYAPFKLQCAKLLADLTACYRFYKDGADSLDFLQDVIVPIDMKNDVNVDDPIEIFRHYLTEEDRGRDDEMLNLSLLGPIIIGTVYCRRALFAGDKGFLVLASSYLREGSYWCGVARGSLGLEKAISDAFSRASAEAYSSATRMLGQAGARSKNEKRELVKKFAFDEVRKRMRPGGWQAMSHAVLAVQDDVIAYSAQVGYPLKKPEPKNESENEVHRTLAKWLSEMPDAKQIFQFGNGGNK